jgi:hypothetical protein
VLKSRNLLRPLKFILIMDELARYNEWMQAKDSAWEARCHRCGACCGALDDPCENLRKDAHNKYYCAVYERRFGKWRTVSGKELTCVPISVKLARGESWPGDEQCGYKLKGTA